MKANFRLIPLGIMLSVLLATFPLAAATQSAQDSNREQEKMFRAFAAELLQTLIGVPVEKIQLTPAGFRIVE